MGKHNAQPTKTDIPHTTVRIVRTRTHTFIVFCKHIIVEGTAGLIAILVFEANRAGWLNLVGQHTETTDHAIRTFTTFL